MLPPYHNAIAFPEPHEDLSQPTSNNFVNKSIKPEMCLICLARRALTATVPPENVNFRNNLGQFPSVRPS